MYSMITLSYVLMMFLVGTDLPSDIRFQGVVRDSNNNPIPNARVDIATAAPIVGEGYFCPSCYLDCRKFSRTDQEGNFTIGGLNPSLKFKLVITAVGKKTHQTKHLDPSSGDVSIVLEDLPQDVPAERIIRGRLVNEDKKPIEGGVIEPFGAKDIDTAVSDADGRFMMVLSSRTASLQFSVAADGYSGCFVPLLRPGAEEQEIMVPVGARVTGYLMNERKPLSGAKVGVVQTEQRNGQGHFIKCVMAVTEKNGFFEIDHLPPNQPYVIYSIIGEGPQEHVITTKKFTAPASRELKYLDELQVIQPLKLSGRILLPEGQSLPPDAKLVLGRDPAWDLISIPMNTSGEFEISGLPPEVYEIHVVAKGWEIDPTKSRYQILHQSSIGLRLRGSRDNVEISLRPEPVVGATP